MNNSLNNIRIGILTLGCKVNSYESDAMMERLESEGAVRVSFEDSADVYIINTCSVTNMADKKSRQMINRARKLSPDSVIIAAGCYVQALDDEKALELSVDAIVGNNKKIDIVEVVKECLEKKGRLCFKVDLAKGSDYEELSISEKTEHTRAYIKIQDGCNQFCTYCIIPYTRGRVRSRETENILEEVLRLAQDGIKEIVLTGIHLSSFEGFGLKGGDALITLCEKIAQYEGIERIRLGSLEPRVVTEDFAKRISENKKVCPHFHLSLQSGSDTVLKRMNRKYDTAEYIKGCELLKKYYDRPAITTDIIVGFPQETEEEFVETCEFAKKVGFSKIHIFKYSRRAGTVADRMTGQVQEGVKSLRSDRLEAIEEELRTAYNNSFVGEEVQILLEEKEEYNGKTYFAGYTERYVRCLCEVSDAESNTIITGKVLEVSGEVLLCK